MKYFSVKELKNKGFKKIGTNVQISKNKLEATTAFLETLEDNDDVQSVYTNLKFINN